MCGYRVLTPEESERYRREKDAEMEASRRNTGVIGQKMYDGALLNIVGPRTRGPHTGQGVKRPRRMVDRGFPRAVDHLLHMYPRTSFEIHLEDIGAYIRQWEVVGDCLTCEATGTIPKDNFNHWNYWARRAGVQCARCSGHGRYLRAYEERIQLPRTLLQRGSLLFKDVDGVFHTVTKKGKDRATRCRAWKGIPEMFLTGFGEANCLLCLAWIP